MRIHLSIATALLATAILSSAQAQQTTLPLWPQGTPEPWHVDGPERNVTTPSDHLVAGRPVVRIADVAVPTLSLYQPPAAKATGAAVLVFPGGGYVRLAWDLEGTEVCDWLNSIGVTCVLVKYRVPIEKHYPDSFIALEDAQQAMRLTRSHAAEWHIDPHRIGVLGFSAGAHLAAIISNHDDYAPAGSSANAIDARPDFAALIYPGYLAYPSSPEDMKGPADAPVTRLAPGQEPSAHTPPTFLVQAEDDFVREENSLFYFQALKEAKVPAELHLFAQGGHGYGLRPTELPVTHWPVLMETWLHTIHVLETPAAQAAAPRKARPPASARGHRGER
ncbi:MAG TPA: alpha/beta hydrolase [Acidisarcina sp.]|nr:alpha/beta hydrolase [Acidisarcina sp.]